LHGNEEKARLAALFLLTQRGAIFLYYGEELGLPNSKISRAAMHDPLGKRYWPFHPGRDPERGPMVWSTGEGNGFTTGESWLASAKAANRYSVENQELEQDSMLHFYRRLLSLRKEDEVLRNGLCTFIDTSCMHILAYCREIGSDQRLILLNMSNKNQICSVPLVQTRAMQCELIFSTEARSGRMDDLHAIQIGPFQGRIYRLLVKDSNL
jgi:alpha-glucosidase